MRVRKGVIAPPTQLTHTKISGSFDRSGDGVVRRSQPGFLVEARPQPGLGDLEQANKATQRLDHLANLGCGSEYLRSGRGRRA